ncbi:amidase [Roseovarius nubinhibens]|uniref:Amidase n=1 Tax=Roseovarius nubinhibens (strain ATCC BAA-591 / DSM 15170 / ISM) TaxID=89187 RepID=A3SP42_ROSNI|nr:amidase [Roseovarius nubinhibens]EAP76232.1 amidase [Roseovarius nubinhibens ISM]
MTDPVDLEASAQLVELAAGRLSVEALIEATLARVAARNGACNAVVSPRDPEEVMAEARAADRAETRGPLHGLPVAIKDLADAKGLPTSHGSPVFAGQIAQGDSLHVARMRAAGAIIIGKTNTPEFGLGSHTYNPVHGATGNAYDPSVSCGGSSGGAAVALAHGMVSLADGSDMMGSLRNPAGWNNVYGMRPSWGRVPSEPGDDLYLHRLATNGPMARSPRDMALFMSVIEGPGVQPEGWPFEPTLLPQGQIGAARLGWLGDWDGAFAFEPGILDLCRGAADVFGDLGCKVEDLAAPMPREVIWDAWVTLRNFSNAAGKQPLLENPKTRDQLKPEAVWEIERGLGLSAMDLQAASAGRSAWFKRAMALFDEYDALLLPSAQVWPFALDMPWPKAIAGQEMDTYHRWMEVVICASILGLPAACVPAGFGDNGLPMGLQIIGAPGRDQQVLELAEAYHRASDWPGQRPPQG